MERLLGGLAALAEDPGSVPSTTWQLTTVPTSVSGDLTSFPGLLATRYCTQALAYIRAKHSHT